MMRLLSPVLRFAVLPAALLSFITAAAGAPGTVVEWGMGFNAAGATGISKIAAGRTHLIGLTDTGVQSGWGTNSQGELVIQNSPFGGTLTAIAAGESKSAGLWSTGRVTWSGSGFNFTNWTDVTAISMKGFQTVARFSDGTVAVDGGVPPPGGLTNVTAVAAGAYHALALKSDGTVEAWGGNNYGESTVPAGLTGVSAIAAGENFSLALKSNGTVVAWGAGATNTGVWPHFGQSAVPAGLSGVTGIAAGYTHAVALKSDGTVVCWGDNSAGQCTVPSTVRNVQQVTAGAFATAAIMLPQPEIVAGVDNHIALEGTRQEFLAATGSLQTRTFFIVNTGTASLTGLALSKDGPDAARFTLGALPVTTLAPGANTTFTVTFAPGAVAGNFFAGLHIASNDPDENPLDYVLSGRTPMGITSWGGATRPEFLQGQVPAGETSVISVDAGSTYSSLVRMDGSVLAWGGDQENSPGYFGAVTPAGPVGVWQAAIGLVDIGGGLPYGAVLGRDGAVYGWNPRGSYSGPALLPAATGARRIAYGENHGIALKNDGGIFQWGGGGQAAVPPGLSDVQDIAVGDAHSVVLLVDGSVVAWGNNSFGQATVPPGLRAVDVAAAGGYTVAVRSDGTVAAWGQNNAGQTTVPAGLTNVIAVEAAGAMVMAVRRDGTWLTWGQSGAPAWLPRPSGIAAGFDQYVALIPPVPGIRVLRDGETRISGQGFDAGWAATGTPRASVFTVRNNGGAPLTLTSSRTGANAADFTVSGLPSSLAAGAGADFTVTFTPSAFGVRLATLRLQSNDPAQPAFDIPLSGRTPMYVSAWGTEDGPGATRVPQGISDAVAVCAGWNFSLALRANGTVRAWGQNDYGQCNVPPTLTNVIAVSAGESFSLALRSNGTVVQWGREWAPLPAGLSGVKAISAGRSHAMALKTDGTVVAWGSSSSGAETVLPDYNTLGPRRVDAGADYSLMVINNPIEAPMSVYSWGRAALSPPLLMNVDAISAGLDHASALLQNGTVATWGSNTFGQKNVPAGLSGVRAIDAGNYFTVALKNDATLAAWGLTQGLNMAPTGYGAVGAVSAGAVHVLALTGAFPAMRLYRGDRLQRSGDSMALGAAGLTPGEPVPVTIINEGNAPLTGLALSAGSGDTADFAFTPPPVTTLAPGASTTFRVRFIPTGSGDKQLTLQIAGNDPVQNPYTVLLRGYSGLTPVQAWRTSWMGNWVNSEPYGNSWDFDGDGVTNMLEFAFGTSPVAASSARGLLQYTGAAAGGGTLVSRGHPTILYEKAGNTVTVRGLWMRRKDYSAAGLVYTPEFAALPNAWTPSATAPQVLATDGVYDVVAVTFPATVPGGVPKVFRVRVAIPNPD